jgi:Integral peroxisomal membrane peroxin
MGLILGMYSRRYSPLSSTSRTGEKHGHKREPSDISTTHHKTLDEIVETLRIFTTRCNLLLEPFLSLTDFLSTQRTPTSATTRPALTTLFIRILLVTPLWILLTLPPFYIITSRRVILTFGTIALTWHSRPARVSRVILWRSLTVRRLCSFITGLSFLQDPDTSASSTSSKLAPPPLPPRSKSKSQENVASDLAMKHRPASPGVRFTFILYENQRRWIGLGWTSAMLAYERASWTDEHLNPAPSKDRFELPHVESETARWRWAKGSRWKIEGGSSSTTSPTKQPSKGTKSESGSPRTDGGGWIYYDNKWNDGKRDADSWGKFTRRRKWYRDAELVEITSSTEVTPNATPNEAAFLSEAENDTNRKIKSPSPKKDPAHQKTPSVSSSLQPDNLNNNNDSTTTIDPDSPKTTTKRKSWFGSSGRDKQERRDSKSSGSIGKKSLDSIVSVRTDPEDDHLDRWKSRETIEGGRTYGLGEDAVMGLS